MELDQADQGFTQILKPSSCGDCTFSLDCLPTLSASLSLWCKRLSLYQALITGVVFIVCHNLEVLFSQSCPSWCHCKSLFLPRQRTWRLALLNFKRFLLAPSSNWSRSLWMVALPLRRAYAPKFSIIIGIRDKGELC